MDYKLSELAQIQVGYQNRRTVEEDLNGHYFLLRGQDFNELGLKSKGLQFSTSTSPSQYLISQGDVLLQARGKYHAAFLVDEPLKNAVAASTFYILRIQKDKTSPAYLAWWLNQTPAQNFFAKNSTKATIPLVSKESVAACPVIVPDLQIQNQIVQLAALAKQEQALLHRLAQQKDSLIQLACLRASQSHNVEI